MVIKAPFWIVTFCPDVCVITAGARSLSPKVMLPLIVEASRVTVPSCSAKAPVIVLFPVIVAALFPLMVVLVFTAPPDTDRAPPCTRSMVEVSVPLTVSVPAVEVMFPPLNAAPVAMLSALTLVEVLVKTVNPFTVAPVPGELTTSAPLLSMNSPPEPSALA